MATTRSTVAGDRRILDRMRALSFDPEQRSRFAAEALAGGALGIEVVIQCAEALAKHPVASARLAVIDRYREFAGTGPKRDPGGFARAALLRALRDIAAAEDADLLDAATVVFEPSAQDRSNPSTLRAAALAALHRVDPERASYRAIRLLADERGTAPNTGEPALTAAKVLAAGGEDLALLLFVLVKADGHEEVVAECLRWLRDLPGEALRPVIARFADDPRDMVLLGYAEMLIGHAPDPVTMTALRAFLENASDADIYRYAIAAIIAGRRDDQLDLVLSQAKVLTDRDRIKVLIEALPLAPRGPATGQALEVLRKRVAG